MPFFPRFSSSPLYPFPSADLFALLDDTRFPDSPSGRRGFSPNFDVHETEHAYVLEGELPGLRDKDNVSLEFTDDKTLLVHGKIERSVKRVSDDQGRIQTIEAGEEQKKITGAGEEGGKGKGKGEKETGGEGAEGGEGRPKYWVSERSVGEFERSFSFPGQVDVEKVKASLEHGILKVVVPKMEKKQGRRIEIG